MRGGKAKARTVNARFLAMCSHYLFEPAFCNRAAGWEKGIVEKNVQDRRRQLWQALALHSWPTLEALNAELANLHDFRQDALYRAVPYGIYDLTHNQGYVYVGTSYDTPRCCKI